MPRIRFVLVLLLVVAFSLAAYLEPRQSATEERVGRSESFLAMVLGEGRSLFANEVFAKADAYFHRGNYPSIFEVDARREENHMAGAAKGEQSDSPEADHDDHAGHAHEHEHSDAEEPDEPISRGKDWIENFGRKFRAADHVHLEKGAEREMLPWLKLSAELDPHSIESYTVSAYWLRERLGKTDEAEQFLREGLRKNPNHPELLNELAWLNFENRNDLSRARNLWRAALRRWHEVEEPKEKPNEFLAERILGGLMQVEIRDGRLPEALEYLLQLKQVSPNPDTVQNRIDELRARMAIEVQP
jgi:tetratricopeptide (TPR) repeat protein